MPHCLFRLGTWLRHISALYRAWRARHPSMMLVLVQVTTIGFSTTYIALNVPAIVRLTFPSPYCALVDHVVTQGDRVACMGEHLDLLHTLRLLKRDGEPLTLPFLVREPSRVIVIVPQVVPPGEYFLELWTNRHKVTRQPEKITVMAPPSSGPGRMRSDGLAVPQPAVLPPGERDRLITFANLDWESARLQTAIARFIVTHGYGYPSHTIPSGSEGGNARELWNGLKGGSIHVFMEAWLPNLQAEWNEALARAHVIPLGKSLDHVWQSAFVIPTYVVQGDPKRGIEARAPHLKTVADLRKYKKVFATSSSRGKALLVNCPPVWHCKHTTEELVKAYGLDDVVALQSSPSAEAHVASLHEAYAEGKPWLGYLWGAGLSPAGDLNLTIVHEPFYSATCLKTGLGCGYAVSQVFLVVHPRLPMQAPDVYEFLRKWHFTTETLHTALQYLEQSNRDFDKATLLYLEHQEAVWTQWVPSEVTIRVKQVLQQQPRS